MWSTLWEKGCPDQGHVLWPQDFPTRLSHKTFYFFKVPLSRVLRPQGLFFRQKLTFDFSKSLFPECYARRGFFRQKMTLYLSKSLFSESYTRSFFVREYAPTGSVTPSKKLFCPICPGRLFCPNRFRCAVRGVSVTAISFEPRPILGPCEPRLVLYVPD